MKPNLLALLAVASATLSGQASAYTYAWTVDKSVDQPDVMLAWGESVEVTWIVAYTVERTGNAASGSNIGECVDAWDTRFTWEKYICGNTTVTFPEYIGPYYEGDFEPGVSLLDSIINDAYFSFDGKTYSDSATVTAYLRETSVPEPGTLALLGLGFAGLGLSRRRKVN